MITRLEDSTFLSGGEKKDGYIDKKAVLVYTGKFKSMDGDVDIKDGDIDKLASTHNSLLKKATRLATGQPNLKIYPPIQLDHSKSARDTVGRLVGDLEIGEHQLTDGTKVRALMGTVRILGEENIQKVEDGRWAHLSIGADLKKHELSELTITPFPAAAEASLLSRGDTNMGYSASSHKMYAKAHKHLCETKKMSEEEADKHLESAKDEEVKKMAEEHDEHEKKLKSKLAEEDDKKKKDKEDGEKKMAAAKEGITKLMSDFRSATASMQLKAREANVSVRLSRLQASGKMTPAERSKINITELASQNDVTVDAVVKSYELREPVIPIGLRGSTKASDPASLAADIKKMERENLELETLSHMPMLKAQLTANNDPRIAKLASKAEDKMGKEAGPSEAGYAAHHDRHLHEKELAKDYETLSKLTDEGKHDEAKEHLKKMKEKLKKLASPAEEHMASDAEHHMSSLAESVKTMQTKFEELQKLVEPVIGGSN